MADGTSIAQIVVFVPLAFISLFCLIKHGRGGILGWLYLHILCIIRIVAAGITLHDDSKGEGISEAALILSSVGLSPLLLSAAGVLHEARLARSTTTNKKVEWLIILHYHVVVSAAIVLVIIGIVNLSEGQATSTTNDLIKAGAAVVLVCWVLLVVAALASFVGTSGSKSDVSGSKGSILLYAVIAAIPLIFLRVLYAAIFLILETKNTTSEFSTSLAIKVCLSVVPEMLVVFTFGAAGIITRNINETARKSSV